MKEMKRYEVLEALDSLYEMNDKEIQMNPDLIRKVAIASYSLIKQKYSNKQRKGDI
ncbi:hypothetical protein J14TS2_16510 [Bacillus sp. J14TS2]|uniref:hypothetical protein n=1 Tax=Bacillus sp. J14TS2 TaxID=2807188 RepID=UPI001B2D8A54|nr:hypothetical protein [Bacillus sp. J14TS2]GIN71176.1 hypothetical protein J14TS2_16510 [Bacillus sp. J14TS2]